MSTGISFQERISTLKVRPSLPDHRDLFTFAGPRAVFPASFDLGVRVPIKDQGRQGACTGHALSSMREALDAIHGLAHVDLSRAFIYALERQMEGTLSQDAGAMPIDGCKVLKHQGVCPEFEMPYNDQVYNVPPNAAAMTDAMRTKIQWYSRLNTVRDVKSATVNHYPCLFGIAVYESFERIGSDGMMPMPAAGESLLGGHAIFGNALGYADDKSVEGGGYFQCQNSWGVGFGAAGYIKMPYAYVNNPQYCFEIRAIWV